uniref:Dynein light chain n=1 Tax=Seriola lalandi dorsalis TaxID=1841481 RepID=A0A3B4WRP6_SERLL
MGDRKAVIKNADMSEDMQQDAVDCATQALEKYNIEKDLAAYIKKERGGAQLRDMSTVPTSPL